MRNNAQ